MAAYQSALFPSLTTAVSAYRTDSLSLFGGNYLPASITDTAIQNALIAAEADASRRLRVFFQPTEMYPTQADADADIASGALDPTTQLYAIDPAYDYDPMFFQDERWGFMVTRQKPINTITSISFAYPLPASDVFVVPADWIRSDNKYGHIRLVPTQNTFTAPLSAYVLQAIGGGRLIPFMIKVRYNAGLTDAANQYPDLLDLVKKMATLRLLKSAFIPQSGSISADGLSQSLSLDLSKYEDGIESMIDTLSQSINGVRNTVIG